jgi:hypothetical protein
VRCLPYPRVGMINTAEIQLVRMGLPDLKLQDTGRPRESPQICALVHEVLVWEGAFEMIKIVPEGNLVVQPRQCRPPQIKLGQVINIREIYTDL